MFEDSTEFSQFDQLGIPTHLAPSGEEISKSRRKKLVKDWETQKKLHAEYRAWACSNQTSNP
jgi:cysteinyl-tRNA synthetase